MRKGAPKGVASVRMKRIGELRARVEQLEAALGFYPFGGLDGLLGELEEYMRAYGSACPHPDSCGPLGCLIAKIHHTRRAIREVKL